jgi:hypothetical protein
MVGIALYGTELFVVDTGRKRVMVFESDGGAFVREFGDRRLNGPLCVAVNVAHKGVVVFDRVDGVCVRTVDIGMPGVALLCTHAFFAVSGDDNVVRVFDATSGTRLHTFGCGGFYPLQFHGPYGMTIVGDRLWILDSYNDRIQINHQLFVSRAFTASKKNQLSYMHTLPENIYHNWMLSLFRHGIAPRAETETRGGRCVRPTQSATTCQAWW